MVGVGHEAQAVDEKFHYRQVVFCLFRPPVYEQSQVGKVGVPIEKACKQRFGAGHGIGRGHSEKRLVVRLAGYSYRVFPVLCDVFVNAHGKFVPFFDIAINIPPPASSLRVISPRVHTFSLAPFS